MKPVLEYLPRRDRESFVVMSFDYPYYPTPWHYHPEYELVLVTESTGKRFIGDQIKDFEPGDLAFIGPDLPHLYRNDERYYEAKSDLRARSIVVHFLEESLGRDFLSLPETENIRALLERSSMGLEITGQTNKNVSMHLHDLVGLEGLSRWLKLMEILKLLAESTEYNVISSQTVTGYNIGDSDRLSTVIDWVLKNYQNEIFLAEAAELVRMTPPSFSRYFKQRTRKNFSEFVSLIRLGHAARLLQTDSMSVAEICFACGFNNLSNFNRQFKAQYKDSPLGFRKQYRNRN